MAPLQPTPLLPTARPPLAAVPSTEAAGGQRGQSCRRRAQAESPLITWCPGCTATPRRGPWDESGCGQVAAGLALTLRCSCATTPASQPVTGKPFLQKDQAHPRRQQRGRAHSRSPPAAQMCPHPPAHLVPWTCLPSAAPVDSPLCVSGP